MDISMVKFLEIRLIWMISVKTYLLTTHKQPFKQQFFQPIYLHPLKFIHFFESVVL